MPNRSAAAIDVSSRLSSGLSLSNEWVQYEDEEHPNHPLDPLEKEDAPAAAPAAEQRSVEQEPATATQRKPVPPLHPTPYTLHPTPYTLHPTLYTL